MGTADRHGADTLAADFALDGPGRGAVRRVDDGRLLRGRRTRARLREAARTLILEVGFDRATLRGIAERAGMGASSIYRHLRSKEELLIWELADLQGEAWKRFRADDDRSAPTRVRVARFLRGTARALGSQSGLHRDRVARSDPSARARGARLPTPHRPQHRLAGRDSAERSQERRPRSRRRSPVRRECAVPRRNERANLLANGLLTEAGCRSAIDASVDLLFRGIGKR